MAMASSGLGTHRTAPGTGPSSPARTWTRCPEEGRTTARSGFASALVALDDLNRRGVDRQPRAIAVFPEEEGSRFGVACLGSRLMTGAIDPARALSLTDADGTTYADAAAAAGLDPARMGPDREGLGRIRAFIELHVEQGRGLVDLGEPVAVASSILGHGRWRPCSWRGSGTSAAGCRTRSHGGSAGAGAPHRPVLRPRRPSAVHGPPATTL